jgi:hypothetical protein
MMKNIKYIVLGLFVFTCVSCSDYLNVNIDPNSPSNAVAAVKSRLPWIQHGFLYAHGLTGARVSFITQQLTNTSRTSRDGCSAQWQGTASLSTNPYQEFFVHCAANINDLYTKAEAEGAYHYMGAAKALKAIGFMMMVDLYGEMPYTEALGEAIMPKFDDGKTIFMGCLADIDEAIVLFEKTQESTATPLSLGDSWNEGKVEKWIKMCYGLKARWLNNLSKKSDLYNAEEILACIAKAPQSNVESTSINHFDVPGDNIGDPLLGDPLQTSPTYDWIGMGNTVRVTKWYVDLMTNFDGKGIEDPRADKLIPHAQIKNKTEWMRSAGVDMQSSIRIDRGPFTTTYNATNNPVEVKDGNTVVQTINPHSWYCATTYPDRFGDTIYVCLRSQSIAYNNATDDIYYAADGAVLASGTFYTRPDGPTHLLCYHEMCFIKAEVLFKQGQTGPAFNAYKEGVKAHMELMNQKLTEYGASTNPAKTAMSQADIDNYLNTALGTAADISLGKIMNQKFIALSYTQQNWNDMRRLDYSATAYPGWAEPYERALNADALVTIPLGKQFRRIGQSSLEASYNSVNLAASHPHAMALDVYAYPVWWDYPTDDYK